MRQCIICGALIPERAHKKRRLCFYDECKKESSRRRDAIYRKRKREKTQLRLMKLLPSRQSLAGGKVKHKSGRPNEKEERKEMFDRLRKNSRDLKARAYLKRKSISFIRLSLGKGRKIEVRIKLKSKYAKKRT